MAHRPASTVKIPAGHADYSKLVVNHGDQRPAQMLDRPRRALVVTELYDGTTATLELDVVARAKGYVCVRQPRDGASPWSAWIPSEDATPAVILFPAEQGHPLMPGPSPSS